MPKVGNRNFPYTRAGQQQAKRYSRATGQPVNEAGQSVRSSGNRSPFPVGPGGRRNAIRRPGPGIAPPRGGMRGAMNPRTKQPLVGPGTGIGGGPRPLPGRRNAIQNPSARLRGPGGRGGSRVMRNPGLSGRIGGGNSPTPGMPNFPGKKAKPGSGY